MSLSASDFCFYCSVLTRFSTITISDISSSRTCFGAANFTSDMIGLRCTEFRVCFEASLLSYKPVWSRLNGHMLTCSLRASNWSMLAFVSCLFMATLPCAACVQNEVFDMIQAYCMDLSVFRNAGRTVAQLRLVYIARYYCHRTRKMKSAELHLLCRQITRLTCEVFRRIWGGIRSFGLNPWVPHPLWRILLQISKLRFSSWAKLYNLSIPVTNWRRCLNPISHFLRTYQN